MKSLIETLKNPLFTLKEWFMRVFNPLVEVFQKIWSLVKKVFDKIKEIGGKFVKPVMSALGYAEGGYVRPMANGGLAQHGPYMVGEKGPELFMPQRAGRIIPNKDLNTQRVHKMLGLTDARGKAVEKAFQKTVGSMQVEVLEVRKANLKDSRIGIDTFGGNILMIPIKRNHFYTKEIISNAVGVYPQFKDLAAGASETTIEFKGGLGGVRYVASGNVSATPPYKSSELVGGYLQCYVTGMSISGTTTLPQLSAYKLQNGIPISEGGFSLATGATSITESGGTTTTGVIGDAIWFSSSQQTEDNIYIEENFDGSSTTLGTSFSSSFGGAAEFSLDDAYVEPTEGAEAIYAGGDAFFGGGGSNNVVHNLEKWFSKGGPDRSDTRVFVRPKSKGRKSGLWTAVSDHRGEKEKWQNIRSFLEVGKIKTYIEIWF